ncbi:MAG: hypothetical protein HQK54_05465 [Oligoflexales bacterium]|nr:hypothetical protein [Oligoflexales bacterium]
MSTIKDEDIVKTLSIPKHPSSFAVVIVSPAKTIDNENPTQINITFEKDVIGFEMSQITITGAKPEKLEGKKSNFVLTIQPTLQNDVNVKIEAGVVKDEQGGVNLAASLVIPVKTTSEITAALDNLRWELPCFGLGLDYCSCKNEASDEKHLTGDNSKTYKVKLRFRGIVEQKTYIGGSNDGGFWQIGGTPDNGSWNVYRLTISNPPQTYYLNRGLSGLFNTYIIDYTKDIYMSSGATIKVAASAIDGLEITNHDRNGRAFIIPDIPPAPAPFRGQFVQINVISIEPQ